MSDETKTNYEKKLYESIIYALASYHVFSTVDIEKKLDKVVGVLSACLEQTNRIKSLIEQTRQS